MSTHYQVSILTSLPSIFHRAAASSPVCILTQCTIHTNLTSHAAKSHNLHARGWLKVKKRGKKGVSYAFSIHRPQYTGKSIEQASCGLKAKRKWGWDLQTTNTYITKDTFCPSKSWPKILSVPIHLISNHIIPFALPPTSYLTMRERKKKITVC